MQARVCVQNLNNGDVQGYLYIDAGMGEQLVTTSPVYASGSKGASGFAIMGTLGSIDVTAEVNLSGQSVDFTISADGGMTTSMFSRSLAANVANCEVTSV